MKKNSFPLDPSMSTRLKVMQGRMSLYQFAAMMGVSRATMVAAMGGFPLHAGTRLLISSKMKELAAGDDARVAEVAA